MTKISQGGADLAQLSDFGVVNQHTSPLEQHAAAITTVEAAIAGRWSTEELRDVLASLGLDNAQEVPC